MPRESSGTPHGCMTPPEDLQNVVPDSTPAAAIGDRLPLDHEALELFAEEAEFTKGELPQVLALLLQEGDSVPLQELLDGLQQSAEALGIATFDPLFGWVSENIERAAANREHRIKATLLSELLSGWLSALIGLCGSPSSQLLRESFVASLERREWPQPIPKGELATLLATLGDSVENAQPGHGGADEEDAEESGEIPSESKAGHESGSGPEADSWSESASASGPESESESASEEEWDGSHSQFLSPQLQQQLTGGHKTFRPCDEEIESEMLALDQMIVQKDQLVGSAPAEIEQPLEQAESILNPDAGADRTPEQTDLRFAEETDPRLLEAFFLETPDLVAQLVPLLRSAGEERLHGDEILEAQRIAHTIKGSCSFVGLTAIYALTYPLEEALEGLGSEAPPPELATLLVEVGEILELLFEFVAAGEESIPVNIEELTANLWVWAHELNPQEESWEEADEIGEESEESEERGESEENETASAEESSSETCELTFSDYADAAAIAQFQEQLPPQVEQLVAALREQCLPGGRVTGEVRELAHAISGRCSQVGLATLYQLTYPLEEVLEGVGERTLPPALGELLLEVADVLELLFDYLSAGEQEAPLAVTPFAEPLWEWLQQLAPPSSELALDEESEEQDEEERSSAAAPHWLESEEENPIERAFWEEGAGDPELDDSGDALFATAAHFDLDAVDSGGVRVALDPDLDPQLVEAFFLETPDQVTELATLLRSAPEGGLVGETILQAQRLAHTIKGACAMGGLDEVRDLAHQLEDLLEGIGGEVSPSHAALPSEVGELLVESGDLLEQLFDAMQAGESEVEVDIATLVAQIGLWAARLNPALATSSEEWPEAGSHFPAAAPIAAVGETDITLAADLDPRLAEAFFMETPDQVAELAVLLRAADAGRLVGELVTEAQRLAHTIKGACALVGLHPIQQFAHCLEDVLEELGEKILPPELGVLLTETGDLLEMIFDAIAAREERVAVTTTGIAIQLADWAKKLAGMQDQEGEAEPEGRGDLQPEDLLWDEQVDPKLLDEFFIEVPENIATLQRLIGGNQIARAEGRASAARLAGTVEHWSRSVGIHPLRRIGQYLKNILLAPRDEPFSPLALGELKESAELLDNLIGAIQGKGDPHPDAGEKIHDLGQWAARVVEMGKSQPAPEQIEVPAVARKEGEATHAVAESSLRVPTARIIHLMRLVGEMTTAVAQLQGRLTPVLEQVSSIHRQGMVTGQRLGDLETLVEVRSKPVDEEGEDFDPLEMDQYHELHGIASSLNESFVDGQEIARIAEEGLQQLVAIGHRQERLSREINEAVLATRMIPVSVLIPRLERTVREACRAAGKRARIFVEGEQLLADTDIINGLRDALMHMLRNSVDHGIESPTERQERGKLGEGRIDIAFRRQGNTILIRVLDDGAGFNLERIRETAAKRGVEIAPDLPVSEILRLILMPGFSTKAKVTTLSGRGIGMDVVRQSVEELGGSMVLNNRQEGGAETIIRLPLTLVSAPVLLVRLESQILAIPSDDVNQILYPDEESISSEGEQWSFRLGQESFSIRALRSLIGRGSDAQEFRDYRGKTVLLIHDDLAFQGVLLDQAMESRDVVVQPLGPWLEPVRGVSGACILADGDIAPILDMRQLLRDSRRRTLADTLDAATFERYFAEEQRHTPRVMVVDDSLSARKSLEIAVEAAGYEVASAIDGMDAIRVLDEFQPDLILSDMEMPRMNGIELTTHVRAREETRDIPLVMITSRSTKKHRDRAMAAGASHYLTKPFDQQQLHGLMRELLNR